MSETLHTVVNRAEKAGKTGNASDAARILTGYLEIHPQQTHPYPYYDAGYFLHEAGQSDAALEYLRKSVQLNPCFVAAWRLLASVYQEAGKTQQAASALKQAAHVTQDPELWYQTAILWLKAKQPQKALVILQKLTKRRDPDVKWLLMLTNTYMMLDQTEPAAATMDRIVAMDPKSEYLYNAGVLWLHAEKPDKALGHLRPLCKRAPAQARWFVALAHAWLALKKFVPAAQAMEQAARLSTDPGHAYRAGLLWLQAKKPDAALRVLMPLGKRPTPQAPWLVALNNAWRLTERFGHAATAMARAAHISQKPDHFYSAAGLWLQADAPRKALPLLQWLTQQSSPLGKWFVSLSNCYLMMDQAEKAALAMERAAEITREGTHYHQAGMLWVQAGDNQKAISLLEICVSKEPVQQQWLVSLARVLLDVKRNRDALGVMARTTLTHPGVKASVRYQGATLWLQLSRPEEALPVLRVLCTAERPLLDWLATLMKTHVTLSQIAEAGQALQKLITCYPEHPKSWQSAVWLGLEQNDYARAAAAMAVAVRLAPPEPEPLKRLADLYHMAGVPVKAAATLQQTWGKAPTAEDWDRLTQIYLTGHRYDMALRAARSALSAQQNAERWKTAAAIAFRLRRFKESYEAYDHAIGLKPDAGMCLRAGYAALKLDKWREAARLFKKSMRLARKNSTIAYEAHRNLAFIKKMRAIDEQGG